MIICETQFELEDPEEKGYSFCEVDYYAWVPRDKQKETGIPNHRLSLRKNLVTGEYEVYRFYVKTHFFRIEKVLNEKVVGYGSTHVDAKKPEEVVFKSRDLGEAVRFGDNEWNRFHSGWAEEKKEPDQVCQHRPPIKAWNCKIWEQTPYEEKMKAYEQMRREERNGRDLGSSDI